MSSPRFGHGGPADLALFTDRYELTTMIDQISERRNTS